MTIYAIVNNFINTSENTDTDRPVWTIISPAAILQGGNPYFVPDFASQFEARTALAIKIGKLGKGIAPRFAGRYVEAAAPAILFVASDFLESVRKSGLPWNPAISYDRSLALGKFQNISIEECAHCDITLSLERHDTTINTTWNAEFLVPGIEETIAAISHDNTLKMGDIILFGIRGSGPVIKPDTRAHLYLDASESLIFNIR